MMELIFIVAFYATAVGLSKMPKLIHALKNESNVVERFEIIQSKFINVTVLAILSVMVFLDKTSPYQLIYGIFFVIILIFTVYSRFIKKTDPDAFRMYYFINSKKDIHEFTEQYKLEVPELSFTYAISKTVLNMMIRNVSSKRAQEITDMISIDENIFKEVDPLKRKRTLLFSRITYYLCGLIQISMIVFLVVYFLTL